MQGIYNYIPENNPVSKDTLVQLFVFAICATGNVIIINIFFSNEILLGQSLMGQCLYCCSVSLYILATLTSCVVRRFNPADFARNLT